MTESQMSVINFDILKNQRSKALKIPNHPASVDALHITDDKSVYLIEFKNGRVYKENIIQKIYDSLVFLFDRKVMSDLSDCAKRLSFILVYNNNDKLKEELGKNPSRSNIGTYTSKLSGTPVIFPFLSKFKNYIFKNTYAYDKYEFYHNFVLKHEKKSQEKK